MYSVAQLEYIPWFAAAYGGFVYIFALWASKLSLGFDVVKKSITRDSGRYGSIDGLRGVLAVGVLVHHSFASYKYHMTGNWGWSDSPVLNQFGQTTVALFFMITGFLFSRKAAGKKIDWIVLYKSRIARLLPLYFIFVLAVFLIVMMFSGWEFKESPRRIFFEFLQWLAFVCFGRPDINGFQKTWVIVAGVNWSLKYEVIFYVFCVPAINFISRFFSPQSCLLFFFFAICLLFFYQNLSGVSGGNFLYAAHFLGGVVISFAINLPFIKAVMETMSFRVLGFFAVVFVFSLISSNDAVAVVAVVIIFSSVVGGASGFGVLKNRAAIWLGDVSYGIYLLHGIFLWITMPTYIKYFELDGIGFLIFLLYMFVLSSLVVFVASLSYIFLERPAMLKFARNA